jgi:penicillin-insensitive murein endopeptidase
LRGAPETRSLDEVRRSAITLCTVALLGCTPKRDQPSPDPTVAPPTADATPAPEPEPAPPPAPPEIPGGGPDPLTLDGAYSTSIGDPNWGRLEGGVPLPLFGPGYRFTPRTKVERRHGTVELVAALVRAATAVHAQMPGTTLTFGDISMPQGGDIKGHGSHRAGRDADVMFYLQTPDGKPADGIAVPLDPKGEGTDYNDLEKPEDDVPLVIDVPRTWAFVQALLGDDGVQIQQIFIVEHLRSMLLEHAKEVGAPKDIVQRFADVTCQPKFPHDDHMHIRVFCTAQDIAGGCEDVAPMFPWQRELLKAQSTVPVFAKPPAKTPGKKRKLTSVAEARAKAGPMHPSVVEFLDRREAWVKKPHPGRKWCK